MAKTEKQEISLYDGAVDIIFYPNSHRYRFKGEKSYLVSVTGATGIIDKSGALIPWAVGLAGQHLQEYFENSKVNKYTREELEPVIEEALIQHTVKKEKAATFGTIVHEWAENFTNALAQGLEVPEIDPEQPEEVLQGINAYIDWYDAHSVKIEASERMVFSMEHEFVGFCDAIGEVNGKRYLIDYKTSKRIYPEMYLQVAAYMFAYEEETGDKLEGAIIAKFGKEDGLFEMVELSRDELVEHYDTFLACLHTKKWNKKHSKWG